MTYYFLCHMLLVTQTNPGTNRRRLQKVVNTKQWSLEAILETGYHYKHLKIQGLAHTWEHALFSPNHSQMIQNYSWKILSILLEIQPGCLIIERIRTISVLDASFIHSCNNIFLSNICQELFSSWDYNGKRGINSALKLFDNKEMKKKTGGGARERKKRKRRKKINEQ